MQQPNLSHEDVLLLVKKHRSYAKVAKMLGITIVGVIWKCKYVEPDFDIVKYKRDERAKELSASFNELHDDPNIIFITKQDAGYMYLYNKETATLTHKYSLKYNRLSKLNTKGRYSVLFSKSVYTPKWLADNVDPYLNQKIIKIGEQ